MHLLNGSHWQTGLGFTEEYTSFQICRMIIHLLKSSEKSCSWKAVNPLHPKHFWPLYFPTPQTSQGTSISSCRPCSRSACTIILQMRKETFKEVNWLGQNPGRNSVQFSHSVVADSLWPHGLQHARPPCPSPIPGVYPDSCPSSLWCHLTISSSVVPFSSCLQSFPTSGSFQMSQLFASSGQNTGVSASTLVLPMNTQDWFPLGWTGWVSLQSKGLSRVFSNTIIQKHQFFGTQLSSQSNSHIHTWLLEKP